MLDNTLEAGTLHDPFSEAARKWPSRIAVATTERQLTFADLDMESDRLAERLITAGVTAGQPVPIVISKSWQQIVAIYAVVKAGAAYQPIDPDSPEARLRWLVAATAPDLIVTSRATALPEFTDYRRVVVDESNLEFQSKTLISLPSVKVNQLAYVMFTSGTTGEPKGVMIEHQAARSTLDAINSTFQIGEHDVVLGLTAATFDLSVWDIFGALGAGATLVLPDKDKLTDVEHWLELIRQFGVTTWNTVPALVELLTEHVEEIDEHPIPASLRRFFLSGDVLPASLPGRLHASFSGARVVNLFGPTETSIWCLHHSVDPDATPKAQVPLGEPLPGHVVELLDADMRPVPTGEAGELYISGSGLARGYWEATELTEAAFPRHAQSGERVYRTGDRARINSDGDLEFLGRRDGQVKLLGHRIELTEVEIAIRRGAGVKDAAVVPVGPVGAYERLIGYVLLDHEQDTNDTLFNLMNLLRRELPRWMRPADLRALREWPLTPNGKLDRAALTQWASAVQQAPMRRPQSEVEVALVEVLQPLLRVAEVDIEAELSTLGVNSLVAAQAAVRLRARLDRAIPIDLLLSNHSVAAAATALQSLEAGSANSRPPADSSDLIPVPSQNKPVRASFGQDQVWFLDQLASGNRAYHFQCGIRFAGALNIEALRDALTSVVSRHEILRTVFVEGRDGHPVQQVERPEPVDLPLVDLTRLDEQRREAELDRLVKLDMSRTFDLASGPLIRWAAYKLTDHDWMITEIEHHLVHDGWSVAVLWREVEELYSAALENRAPIMRPVPLQFGDYAAWQRRQYTGGRRDAALKYWTDKLTGSQPLDLVVARTRPDRQTFNGHAIRFTVPTPLYDSLRKAATQQGVSLYSLMASAFFLLLHRYSDQEDICVGSWMANREEPATEDLIGMLVNMVALRIQVEDSSTVSELIARIHAAVGEALSYQDAPFDDVVRALRLPRDPSRNPLIQTSFSFHDSPIPDLVWPAGDDVTRGRIIEYNNESAKFDLNIVVIPRAEQRRQYGVPDLDDELAILWEFNTDLFDKRDIETMIDHYLGLLEGLVERPHNTLVGDFMEPTDRDRQRMQDLNQTGHVSGRDAPGVIEAFSAQVLSRPSAIAVSDEHFALTYSEVDHRVAVLASSLADVGIREGSVVGICVERDVWQVIAILTLLRMGATYVPLDPRHPSQRRQACLNDAGAQVVLTSNTSRERETGDTNWEVRLPGTPLLAASQRPVPSTQYRSLASIRSEAPAYIVHTSGSTGNPKGVRVPRRALDNVVDAIAELLDFGPEDCMLSVTTPAFDIAALEMLLPLARGGHVVIANYVQTIDGELLRERLERGDITALQATPMTWRMLIAAGWQPMPDFIVLSGGDKLDDDLAEELAGARAWNLYGPSETTIWSTAHRLRKTESPVPIGTPIRHTNLTVVDQTGRAVPSVLPGELVIRGEGVALGYTDTSLDAGRFAHLDGHREYHTGDVVRLDSDTNLHFLGRGDRQIKFKGHRIELGEIETILRTHPEIADAAAFVSNTPERIVGLIVSVNGPPVDLVDHLRCFLPKYMIPAQIVSVDSLPRTLNDKLDRVALSKLVPSHGLTMDTPNSPGTDKSVSQNNLEKQLTKIWSELLEIDDVEPDDDFFELGGHSLLALLLVKRIRALNGQNVSVEMVMDSSTPRALADSMGKA